MKHSALLVSWWAAALLVLPQPPNAIAAAEPPLPASPPTKVEETNAQDLLRSYLQLQEQLHEAQLSIEQTRKESRESAIKNTEALTTQLKNLEAMLSSQRAREVEAMQSSNRVMLIMAGIFAALGFIAMVLMAYFQWRTVHGLAQISAVLPAAGALGPGRTLAPLGPGALPSVSVDAANSNGRLLSALGELEKRILGLEQASRPALKFEEQNAVFVQPGNGKHGRGAAAENGSPAEQGDEESTTAAPLLAKGQALLDKDEPAAALVVFEEAVAKFPTDSEALVKKGSALERLGRLQEAVECYDQAIAANDSLTLAYLHKGGLFNRMEKFAEALDCYEKALHTQERRQE